MQQAVHHLQVLMGTGVSPRSMLILLQGVLSMTLGGVMLYVNAGTEESYIELAPGYDNEALVYVTEVVERIGYEVMEEVGAIEEFEDGRIRNYIAQTWFSDEDEEELVRAS